MEINATQTIGTAWDAAATTIRTSIQTGPLTVEAPTPAPVVLAAADLGRDTVTLAQAAAQPTPPPPPPARPLERPLPAYDFHPLASAAGRFPLLDKMLEDVFGLDATHGPVDVARIDLAA